MSLLVKHFAWAGKGALSLDVVERVRVLPAEQIVPISITTAKFPVNIVLIAGLVVSTIDRVMRIARYSPRIGTAAVIAGASVGLVSLFGLLWGVAGIGVAGGLLILSGLPTPRKNVK